MRTIVKGHRCGNTYRTEDIEDLEPGKRLLVDEAETFVKLTNGDTKRILDEIEEKMVAEDFPRRNKEYYFVKIVWKEDDYLKEFIKRYKKDWEIKDDVSDAHWRSIAYGRSFLGRTAQDLRARYNLLMAKTKREAKNQEKYLIVNDNLVLEESILNDIRLLKIRAAVMADGLSAKDPIVLCNRFAKDSAWEAAWASWGLKSS